MALLALTLVALALRFYRLDARSLWLDEILTSQTAHLDSPAAVIAWSRAAINQMPLFYMFTWLLGRWGDSAFILRLPAAIAGTLLVPAVYLLGRSLLGVRAGLVAALITAVLPFTVWYSQEARSYSLLMLLTTLQMYFAFRAVTRGDAGAWAGLAAFSVFNLYTHYVALAALAAVAVYVGAFVTADLFKGTSMRAKIVAAGLGVIVLAMAITERDALLATGGSLITRAHGHQTELLGIAAFAVVALVVAGTVTWRSSGAFRTFASSPRARRLELGLATAAVVAIAYAPWLSSLRLFLSRPDQSLGQIHLAHAPGLADLGATLTALNLDGILLVALVVGLVAAIVWTFRDRATPAGLLLAWLGVPLALFTLSAGANVLAIDARYVSFLLPAALILVGAGVEATIVTGQALARRLKVTGRLLTPGASAAATIVLLAALLVQSVPALAASYGNAKNDWRGAAERLSVSSPPTVTVLSLGNYSDWSVICLDYYFKEQHTTIDVEDARTLDPQLAGRLQGSTGQVWGIVIFPSREQMALLSSSSAVQTDFVDTTRSIWLVRATAGDLSPLDQAVTLLRWELPLQPELVASLQRIDGGTPA